MEREIYLEKHFCVLLYVYNPKNRKFLLVKHRKTGKWLQPGGHIELNEDPEEAALRETFEETGINVTLIGKRFPRKQDFITPLAFQKNIIENGHIHIDIVYLAYPLENQKEVINYNETEGLGWFTLDEIINSEFQTFDDVKYWCSKIVNCIDQ